MSLISPFPLAACTDQDLQSLCSHLWAWNICDDCKAGRSVGRHDPQCSWVGKKGRLENYFAYYRSITASYVPELLPGNSPALEDHQQLHTLIEALKNNGNVLRGDITNSFYASHKFTNRPEPPAYDQNKAVDLALRVMAMLNCAADDLSLNLLESGVAPLPWREDETLLQFFDKIFPQATYQLLDTKSGHGRSPGITALLAAVRLKSIARLTLEPTDDIRDHLRLDQSTGVVLVYHHVGYLVECLRASRHAKSNGGVEEEMKM